MRVRYLPRAFAELEAIHDYLLKRSPQSALRTTTAIGDEIRILHIRHSARKQPAAGEL